MIKSVSVMRDAAEVCGELRIKYFGDLASAKDYKDSFVINKAVEDYKDSPEKLMSDIISKKDQNSTKVPKSINFRAECFEKIITISNVLHISEAEVCRRILYYSLDNEESADMDFVKDTSALQGKIALLESQLEASMATLHEILKMINN